MMLACTDVHANEDIDGTMLLNVLHRSISRLNGLQQRWQVLVHVMDGVGVSLQITSRPPRSVPRS